VLTNLLGVDKVFPLLIAMLLMSRVQWLVKDGDRAVAGVNILTFLQCFDTDVNR